MWGHFTLCGEVPFVSDRNAAFMVRGGTDLVVCLALGHVMGVGM